MNPISPYLFSWQAEEETEEQAERHDPVDGDHMAAMRLDVAAGMASGVAVMFARGVAVPTDRRTMRPGRLPHRRAGVPRGLG
jgi:hypothetical protein